MEIKIDFMCVGVQKAGTTTLHNILNQHSALCLPTKKETHFFSITERFSKGEQYYFNNFEPTLDSKYFGEIDPDYAFFNDAAKKIYDMFGDIKIIFILRNPVDRAYSQYLMTKRRGIENYSFEKAFKIENQRLKTGKDYRHYSYASRGYYKSQIEAYEKFFSPQNIKIVLFEDFIKDTKIVVNEISEFIGLPTFNYDINIQSNPNSKPKVKLLQKLIYKENPIKSVIGALIPSKDNKRKLAQFLEKLNLKETKKEQLSLELKKSLYKKYYAQEISDLEQRFNLDLDLWKI